MGKNAKGSVFIDLVKVIRKDKSGVFSKYLTDKDREIIGQTIFPSTWYPFETYKHCLMAIFEVIAKNDLEVAKEWGRTSCQAIMPAVYASVIKKCDPISFIKKYESIVRNFYDFGKVEVVVEGKNRVLYNLSDYDENFVVIYYLVEGWIERGLELCGAKNAKSEFVMKSWEGAPYTSMRFTWT